MAWHAQKEKQLRDALNGEGGKKVKDADKKKITVSARCCCSGVGMLYAPVPRRELPAPGVSSAEYMEAQDAREKWMEDLTERKE